MTRGATSRGRKRAERREVVLLPERPLLRGVDHGEAIVVRRESLGLKDDRWVEPFLAANRAALERLELAAEVRADPSAHVALRPGSRVGAAPLLSPATRKVASGLLVEPRFAWSALGAVCGAIGFEVEPRLGAGPLVPGSQRQVPPSVIAAPVLRRMEALVRHARRGFVEVEELRAQPRGRVDWSRWARAGLGRGAWDRLPCTFTEPDRDPELLANARWTVQRVIEGLARWEPGGVGRRLVARAEEVRGALGEGPARRPAGGWERGPGQGWVAEAVEAMGWVAEERGLGGGRVLDGLAWDLPVDAVWEAWVRATCAGLGPRLGLVAEAARSALRWEGRVESMGALVPDVVLRGEGRVVVVDAKYKAHLRLLAKSGWRAQSESVREAHRADLHQALAYAALYDAELVDVALAYPALGAALEPAVATVVRGRRMVRLWLMEVPFGFAGAEARAAFVEGWAGRLRAP